MRVLRSIRPLPRVHLHTQPSSVRTRLARRLRRGVERGITTAEYAVGTAAGAGLAGLLYKMLTGGFGNQLLQKLYDHVLRLLGI